MAPATGQERQASRYTSLNLVCISRLYATKTDKSYSDPSLHRVEYNGIPNNQLHGHKCYSYVYLRGLGILYDEGTLHQITEMEIRQVSELCRKESVKSKADKWVSLSSSSTEFITFTNSILVVWVFSNT